MALVDMPLGDIDIGARHRQDLGDIDALAASIRDVGLLQPVVVTTEGVLVAGRRRLAAFQALNRDTVLAHVVDNLTEASQLLRAERDENVQRKAFTPTEEHALYEALLALEKPRAQERSEANLKRGPHGPSGKVSPSGRAKEAAAEAATGSPGRHKTLDKVGEVKRLAQAEDAPVPVRKVAEQALAEMDATGRVDGAYRRVKAAEEQVSAAQPSAAVSDFVESSQSVQDARYVHNFHKALAHDQAWLRFDPDRLGSLLDEVDVGVIERHAARARAFADAVKKSRRGLRVVQGGAR